MISDKYKTLFVHVPKTGGTSVEVAFGELEYFGADHLISGLPPHLTGEDYKKRVPQKWGPYFRTTFIRNPFDKFVSEWRYFSEDRGREFPSKDVIAQFRGLSFLEFANKWLGLDGNGGNLIGARKHRWTQSSITGPLHQYHFIGHFEQFEQDLEFLLDVRGVDSVKVLPKENAPAPRKDWRTFYEGREGGKVAQIVREYYRNDFEAFGYSTSVL